MKTTNEMIVDLCSWGWKPSTIAEQLGVTTRAIQILRAGVRHGVPAGVPVEGSLKMYIAVQGLWAVEAQKARVRDRKAKKVKP